MLHRAGTSAAFFAAALLSMLSRSMPALAESHLPSLDIIPTVIYATSGYLQSPPGVPPVNGDVVLNWTALFPLVRLRSVSRLASARRLLTLFSPAVPSSR